MQVLADSHGNAVHLYERDCSVQRRHQKVVEIAPAPNLDDAIRQKLFADAIKIAKKVNYVNAGTVEFMVDKHGQHFFLEVNPRIQVEHTCTEEITGVDLVQCQLKIAAGATLAECGIREQASIPPPAGFAVQCRVTCEDPGENFKPDNGRLEAYRLPGGPGIRLDGAVAAGNVISRYYDSLLTKVISHAPTYEEALRKLDRALSEFFVRGIKTNIGFVINVLRHPEFAEVRALRLLLLHGAPSSLHSPIFWDDATSPCACALSRSRASRKIEMWTCMCGSAQHRHTQSAAQAQYNAEPIVPCSDCITNTQHCKRVAAQCAGPGDDLLHRAQRRHALRHSRRRHHGPEADAVPRRDAGERAQPPRRGRRALEQERPRDPRISAPRWHAADRLARRADGGGAGRVGARSAQARGAADHRHDDARRAPVAARDAHAHVRPDAGRAPHRAGARNYDTLCVLLYLALRSVTSAGVLDRCRAQDCPVARHQHDIELGKLRSCASVTE